MKAQDQESPSFDLSSYHFEKLINEGSLSKVLQVVDKNTGRTYSALILKQFQTQQFIQELKKEVDLLVLTRFPSILSFVGYSPKDFEGKQTPVIITESFPNGSLYQVIRQANRCISEVHDPVKSWNNTTKLITLYGIAAGMAFLYSKNIIHGDLATENIFVDENFYPKIGGVLKLSHSNPQPIDTSSSFTDTSESSRVEIPEVESNQARDVYAFGFILYEVLTNEILEWHSQGYQSMQKAIDELYRPVMKPDIPPKYQKLLEACWKINPDDRTKFSGIKQNLKKMSDFRKEIGADSNLFQSYTQYITEYEEKLKNESHIFRVQDFLNDIQPLESISMNCKHETNVRDLALAVNHEEESSANQQSKLNRSNNTNVENKTAIQQKINEIQRRCQQKIEEIQRKARDEIEEIEWQARLEIEQICTKDCRQVDNRQRSQEISRKNLQENSNSFDESAIQTTSSSINSYSNETKEQSDDLSSGDGFKEYMDLNGFTSCGVINSGGFATVYQARENKTNTIYAIKVLNINWSTNPKKKWQTDFNREVGALQRLRHAAIVRYRGISTVDFNSQTHPCIITDYYKFTLEQFICQKGNDTLDDTQKLIILYGIAHAMSYLHKKGCVHRDLKPANILLDNDKYPVICDFGLAKFFDNPDQTETTEGRQKGTFRYMAPEQFWGSNSQRKPKLAYKIDLYSYGIILYEVIANQKAFYKKTENEILDIKNGKKKFKLPYDMPECYKNLCNACLKPQSQRDIQFRNIVKEMAKANSKFRQGIDQARFDKYIESIGNSGKSCASIKKYGPEDLRRIRNGNSEETSEQDFVLSSSNAKKLFDSLSDAANLCKIGISLYDGADHFPHNQYIGKLLITHALDSKRESGAIKWYQDNFPNDFAKYIKSLAENNDRWGQYKYGKYLFQGRYFEKDLDKGMKYIITAKNQGLPKAEAFYKRYRPEQEHTKLVQSWENEEKERMKRIPVCRLSDRKKFPIICRKGIPSDHRKNIWFHFSGGKSVYSDPADIIKMWAISKEIYTTPKASSYHFGNPYEFTSNITDLLSVIRNLNPILTFSPLIPNVISMLVKVLSEDEAHAAIQGMINKTGYYFPNNAIEFNSIIDIMETILVLNCRRLCNFAKDSLHLNPSDIIIYILPIFFSDKIDENLNLTLFDSYIIEGQSVLIRFIIGSLLILESDLMRSPDMKEFITQIYDYFKSVRDPDSVQRLISQSFSFGIKSKSIKAMEIQMNSHTVDYVQHILPSIDEFMASHLDTSQIKSSPHISRKYVCYGKLLTQDMFRNIRPYLPVKYQSHEAHSIYLMSKHGASSIAFNQALNSKATFILVIKTHQKTFGAMFKAVGDEYTCVVDFDQGIVYKNMGKNRHFVIKQTECFMIGGPNAAIYFQLPPERVFSSQCETFQSPPFIDDYSLIIDLEIYELRPYSKD